MICCSFKNIHMKKIFYYTSALVLFLSACNKPEAVLFNDRSTAGKADRTAWTATASSEELVGEGAVNGRTAALFDGNYNSFWHSQWMGASPVYPHWMIVDMKSAVKAISVDLTARQNNVNGMTKFTLEGSTDATTWTNLKKGGGNFVFDPANKAPQGYAVISTNDIRYLRVMMTEGKTTSTHLAEIEVYTAK
jgi:hypothetical protein